MPVIASLPYTITSPGLYTLAGSLSTSGNGITVQADDVTVDLCGHRITGPAASGTAAYGISAFNQERITVRNGTVRGFMYGVYLSDLIDTVRAAGGSLDGGGHLVENLNVSGCTFRGVRVEGNGNVVRGNVVREIGGSTQYPSAYGFGIESYGPGALIENNFTYETRGYGTADVGEGVGISVTDYGSGSVLRGNVITQSSRELNPKYADWPAASRSSYGVWVGGDSSDVTVEGNVVSNFVCGITFHRTSSGVFQRNTVNNAVVPYYLPNLAGLPSGAMARDGGGNSSDVGPADLLPGRNTAGPVEYVEEIYLAARA